jgi:enoyl-CoA hydratase
MPYENKLIVVEKYENHVAKITLNAPPLNLNTVASIAELTRVLRKIEQDDDIRAVVFTGCGQKAFCAGSDIKELWGDDVKADKFVGEIAMMDAIEFLPKATIAAIEGVCMGGGLELALCCDLRILSATAKMASPEILLGVFPAGGGLNRLPKVVGQAKALEMMYLGESIDARECERIGLVNKVVPEGETVAAALEMAGKIAEKAPNAIQVIKKGVREMMLKPSTENHYPTLDLIDAVFRHPNCAEGTRAFLAKRKPDFR